MSGNTIGKAFTVTTFGESHGPALGCIVDGCPPGLELSEADLQPDIDRRRTGTSQFVSQRREGDMPRILSGVFEGRTTGTPIGIVIENTDARSRDYDKIKDRFRPGHADYTYQQKYGFRDYRGGGRSSARETVMRVAAGAIARKYLAQRLGIRIHGFLSRIGDLTLDPVDPPSAYDNPFFCPDPARVKELEDLIWKVRSEGDSLGRRARLRPPRRRHRLRHDGDQRGQGRGDRCGRRQRAPARQRPPRRTLAAGLPGQQRRRDPRRDLERPGRDRARLAEADLEHPGAGAHHRRGRATRRRRDHGPP
jgi:hypothetical protein